MWMWRCDCALHLLLDSLLSPSERWDSYKYIAQVRLQHTIPCSHNPACFSLFLSYCFRSVNLISFFLLIFKNEKHTHIHTCMHAQYYHPWPYFDQTNCANSMWGVSQSNKSPEKRTCESDPSRWLPHSVGSQTHAYKEEFLNMIRPFFI